MALDGGCKGAARGCSCCWSSGLRLPAFQPQMMLTATVDGLRSTGPDPQGWVQRAGSGRVLAASAHLLSHALRGSVGGEWQPGGWLTGGWLEVGFGGQQTPGHCMCCSHAAATCSAFEQLSDAPRSARRCQLTVQTDSSGAPVDVVTLVSHGSIVLRCRGPQLSFDLEWCLNVSSECVCWGACPIWTRQISWHPRRPPAQLGCASACRVGWYSRLALPVHEKRQIRRRQGSHWALLAAHGLCTAVTSRALACWAPGLPGFTGWLPQQARLHRIVPACQADLSRTALFVLAGFTGWLPLAGTKREWANGPASQVVHPLHPLDDGTKDTATESPAVAAQQQQQQWRRRLVRLVTAATCIADVAAQRDMLLFGGERASDGTRFAICGWKGLCAYLPATLEASCGPAVPNNPSCRRLPLPRPPQVTACWVCASTLWRSSSRPWPAVAPSSRCCSAVKPSSLCWRCTARQQRRAGPMPARLSSWRRHWARCLATPCRSLRPLQTLPGGWGGCRVQGGQCAPLCCWILGHAAAQTEPPAVCPPFGRRRALACLPQRSVFSAVESCRHTLEAALAAAEQLCPKAAARRDEQRRGMA